MKLSITQLNNLILQEMQTFFEDEDATEPLAGASSSDSPVRNDIETMVGVRDLEYIASGQFGDVYSATHPEHGDVAVKILSTTTGGGRGDTMTIQREINNYELVGIAVESNPQVAKHFPKVYDVGYKTIPDGVLGYIVMELVRPHNYSDEIISSLFAGLEFFKRREVGVDIMGPEPISQDIQLMTNVGNIGERTDDVFLNDEQQVKNMASEFWNAIKSQVAVTGENSRVYTGFTDMVLSKMKYDLVNADTIDDDALRNRVVTAAREILAKFPDAGDALRTALRVVRSDFKDNPISQLGVMSVIKSSLELIDKHFKTYSDFDSDLSVAIEDISTYPRLFLAILPGYSASSLDVAQRGLRDLSPAVKSIEKAFVELNNEVGLVPRDLHSGNAMVKADTGDIVIIDFGMFRTN